MSESEKFPIDPSKDIKDIFDFVEKLGEGSYGSVWKVVHKETGAICALKKVPMEDDNLETLMKEITFMRELSSSDYVVRCFGSLTKDGILWIMMEFCGIGSISDVMRIRRAPLTEAQIRAVLKQTVEGLKYLHSAMKIHRDIKAGNILVTPGGECKLGDFGVSGQLSDAAAKRCTVIGTPFWMAPEVIQEVGYGVKADIWSLGITAIELADGRPPLHNVHPMRAIFKIPHAKPPTVENPDKFSDEFNDFVAKCLVKKPDERPSAEDLLQHPFLTSQTDKAILVDILQEVMEYYSEKGRDISDSDESDEESSEDSDDKTASDSSSSESEDDDNFNYESGTVLVTSGSYAEDCGTMKKNDIPSDEYKPSFLKHMQGKQDNQSKESEPFSISELKNVIESLEPAKKKELESLQQVYQERKQPVLEELSRRS